MCVRGEREGVVWVGREAIWGRGVRVGWAGWAGRWWVSGEGGERGDMGQGCQGGVGGEVVGEW